ncbi:hypothetical protein [Streptomyces sp. NPDC006463]|uniref:hypothetical protein n=1 Tax=Streptomyces sp. NPDC006463 TaxID=3364746 RepID=UPI0036792242
MTATGTAHPPAFWLRDNCPRGACHDPRNGQELFQITDLPEDLAVGASASEGPGT